MSTDDVASVTGEAKKALLEHPDIRSLTNLPGGSPSAQDALAWATGALKIDIAASARRRRVTFLRRIMAFIALPTLLATIYVYWYATPRYVSEFQITYQSFDQSAMGGSAGVLSTMLGMSASTVDMSRVIASYLTSSALLEKIDAKLNLRAHYGSRKVDWLDRLSPGAPQEQFLSYFQRRVSVDALMGGYVVVDVEAFDPTTALKIANSMAAAADDMVEDLTTRALNDQVRLAEAELARTQGRLIDATVKVTRFRNGHNDFDPQLAATQLGSVVGTLESQLSSYRAALASAQTFLDSNAPTVKELQSEIRATEQQITIEQNRLASTATGRKTGTPGGSEPYSQLVADYVSLIEEQQFATDAYLSAKQALDVARANAAGKRKYAVTFVKPNLPQKATSPDPLHVISQTFIVALLIYMIGNLLVGAFRDQAGA